MALIYKQNIKPQVTDYTFHVIESIKIVWNGYKSGIRIPLRIFIFLIIIFSG